MSGYIYCLSNKVFPNLLKIGKTKNDPIIRIKQLYTTGVPLPFTLEFAKKVKNHHLAEKNIHILFKDYRYTHNREFFEITKEIVFKEFEKIDGEYYEYYK
jgi:hypothetical protein